MVRKKRPFWLLVCYSFSILTATPEVRGSEGNLAQQDVAGVVMENQPLQDQSPVLDAAIGSGKKIKPTEMAPELMCNQPIDIQKNRFFEMDSSAPANQGTADIQEDQFSETDNPALTNQGKVNRWCMLPLVQDSSLTISWYCSSSRDGDPGNPTLQDRCCCCCQPR